MFNTLDVLHDGTVGVLLNLPLNETVWAYSVFLTVCVCLSEEKVLSPDPRLSVWLDPFFEPYFLDLFRLMAAFDYYQARQIQ